jgi:hypothetical protein
LAKASDCMNHYIVLPKWHKVEVTSPNLTQNFSLTGLQWNMELPRDQF